MLEKIFTTFPFSKEIKISDRAKASDLWGQGKSGAVSTKPLLVLGLCSLKNVPPANVQSISLTERQEQRAVC